MHWWCVLSPKGTGSMLVAAPAVPAPCAGPAAATVKRFRPRAGGLQGDRGA